MPESDSRRVAGWMAIITLAAVLLFPYAMLVVISCGSGWSFPRLLPDRVDFAPWKHFFSDRDGLLRAMLVSAGMSFVVGFVSTSSGLLIGRSVRRSGSVLLRFLIYLPFVVSPVVVGVCLYDLLVRLGLAGTMAGVILLQSVFATAFASVLFSELWSARAERLELLVRNLGGSERDVWRHAVLPQLSGLIVVCFVQTALFSWLDYGLVSLVGGGQAPTVTLKLFSFLREASVNQTAQAALVLLIPSLAGFLLAGIVYAVRNGAVRNADSRS